MDRIHLPATGTGVRLCYTLADPHHRQSKTVPMHATDAAGTITPNRSISHDLTAVLAYGAATRADSGVQP